MAALIQFANGAPGIKYNLDKREILIGRKSDRNDICLQDNFVSKQHAKIIITENITEDGFDYFIEDLDSTNKTYVNDDEISKVKLQHNDVIRIGHSTLKFDGLGDSPALEAVAIEEPQGESSTQTTWSFSRRLRMLGTD